MRASIFQLARRWRYVGGGGRSGEGVSERRALRSGGRSNSENSSSY